MVDPKSAALVDEMLSHLRADFADRDTHSRVAQLYANKSVFITGATGFIGKALVEKLVRSCPGIKKIYLLVREKRGKDVKSRLTELMQSQIFNRIKSHPDGAKMLEQKLHAIQGDITLERFGIGQEDMRLLSEEVSIVFNSAATIRFVEPLDVAVRNNIYSVGQLVAFCNQLQNLQALVHLSTAYSNCHKRDTIYEIFYEPPMSGEQIIQACSVLREIQNSIHVYPSVGGPSSASAGLASETKLANGVNAATADSKLPSRSACELQTFYEQQQRRPDDREQTGAPAPATANNKGQNESADLLEQFTEIALRRSNRPNTYTFTKAIAESYLLELVSRSPQRYLGPRGIPVAIVRPSIVGGAWREPDVGFVDNYNGGTGAILSMYTGALQAMPGYGQGVADVVPVDMVVNMIISTGFYLAAGPTERGSEEAIKADKGVYIFNFVSGYRNPLRWYQTALIIREIAYKYPSKFIVRMCGSYFVSAVRPNLYTTYDYLNHYLPAKLQDFVRQRVMGIELTSRNSALATYWRIKQMTDTLTPFTSNQWLLRDSNVLALHKQLTAVDRQLFQFDIGQINWKDYVRNYALGARIYTLKDEPRNVPQALKSLKKRQLVYRSSLMILAILFYFLFVRSSQLESCLVGSLTALALSD